MCSGFTSSYFIGLIMFQGMVRNETLGWSTFFCCRDLPHNSLCTSTADFIWIIFPANSLSAKSPK